MCGIVGLMLKKPELRPRLGEWVAPMFACMADRGPDSGGLAVYRDALAPAFRRFSLFAADDRFDWQAWLTRLTAQNVCRASIEQIGNHATLETDLEPNQLRAWLTECDPAPRLLSVGRHIEVFKDQGSPTKIVARYNFSKLTGTHAIGHTRMATESQVSPAHAHPYTAGEDFCLVHNGSLSNPYMLRRQLERRGVKFETDNDTEAACRFIEWRLMQGDSVPQALQATFKALDGFYTLLIGTPGRITLVRDAYACKPAIIAETDDYVAIASEYRSLAHLPGVEQARLTEPKPQEVYTWSI